MIILETQRLRLRTWQEPDWPYLRDLLGATVTMAHWPQPLDELQARAWFDRSVASMAEYGFARWCCERREDDQIVGDIGVVRNKLQGEWVNDLGYIIDHRFWRLGYALEAAAGVVHWARDFGLDSLQANMAVDNLPSAGLAQALGMTLNKKFVNPRNANKLTYWFELNL